MSTEVEAEKSGVKLLRSLYSCWDSIPTVSVASSNRDGEICSTSGESGGATVC